ncbi:hypothetical protein AB3S75_012493 [Citrus x aurantiifolia]
MTGEALQISPANDPRGSPAKEQQAAGVGILLQIIMLVLSFVLGHVLRRHKFYYLPEASASLLIGATCLLMILFSWQKPFFSNFGAIVTFAIFGTLLASMVTGILVYLGGVMFVMYRLPFVECLMFGALISATYPVTVLSIFQVNAAGDLCAICQEKMHAPILLRCKHIFCEDCVSEWFERERTCPLCRLWSRQQISDHLVMDQLVCFSRYSDCTTLETWSFLL